MNCLNIGTIPSILRITSTLLRKSFLHYKKSTLFIPGSKASQVFSYLTPHLDFDERFADIKKLEFALHSRKININIEKLKDSWEFYKFIEFNRKTIERQREEVAYKIKQLKKEKQLSDDKKKGIESLKLQGKILKTDLKIIRDILWELEETTIIHGLNLPNEIDEITPVESVILQSVKPLSNATKICSKSHIDIGKSLHLIEYKNSLCYFLTNEAALFEIGVLTWIGKILNQDNLIRISGTDFSQSFVVEAAGLDQENPQKSFILDHLHQLNDKDSINKLHLIGGASFVAFLAMHTKQLINPKSLPIKYYTLGRQYIPISSANTNSLGLFGVNQESVVHFFAILKDKKSIEYQNEFQKMIKTILKIYDELGRHYRVILKPASKLKVCESLNISFELWSRFKQDYIEVGHLSMCGDYCSKRLLIAYQTPHGKEYPAIISGTILSIPKLLGCLLEENEDKFVIPDCVKKCMPLDNEYRQCL